MNSHLAILGRQPELGLIELESRYGAVESLGHSATALTAQPEVATLGGTLKAGPIIYRGPVVKLATLDLPALIAGIMTLPARPEFGISFYGRTVSPRTGTAQGLELKQRFGTGRYVAPRDGQALTAAQLKFHRLLNKGFELLVAYHQQEMIIAVTNQFQDIDWYTSRDRDRPGRDAKIGMLPPKLAQILVNTTSGPVYDPFSGTGVILMEALLMGRAAHGSDTDPAMVEATHQNLEWLTRRRGGLPEFSIQTADARNVTVPPGSSIVSEGYLGAPLSTPPNPTQLRELESEVLPLYRDSLTNFARQLPSGRDVTICAPAWRQAKGWYQLPLIDQVSDLGYTVRRFASGDSRRLLYSRPDQIVGRQILLLRKN